MENPTTFNIPITKPYFAGGEADLVRDALERGWIIQGPLVQQFEQQIAKFTQASFAVATTSCTTALHLSLIVHNIGRGHDVICPSYTFIATANAIRHAGAEAVFCDIDPGTLNLDAALVRNLIETNYDSKFRNKKSGSTLKAILLVHQIGIAADIDKFKDLANEFGLDIIEDSACGLGSTYKGRPIGSSGNANTFSFHPRKVITTGEGGMVLTNNQEHAERMQVLRAHGASIPAYNRFLAQNTKFESYNEVGYNYRMTDIQAAIGIRQLEVLPWIVHRRNEIASLYNAAFRTVTELELVYKPSYQDVWNYQSYPIRLKSGSRQNRDRLMAVLGSCGIATRRGIPPIHKEPAYDTGLMLPQTENVSDASLFLPLYPQMTDAEIEHVIASVSQAMESERMLSARALPIRSELN